MADPVLVYNIIRKTSLNTAKKIKRYTKDKVVFLLNLILLIGLFSPLCGKDKLIYREMIYKITSRNNLKKLFSGGDYERYCILKEFFI